MNSAVYIGQVMHQRIKPVHHAFVYDIHMSCLDLDELDELNKAFFLFGYHWWNPIRFNRNDYLGKGNVKQAAIDKLYELTGERINGRVMLLCQLRYFGLYFSPVNFYYLFDEKDQWRYLLAEVSNTPWNEKHYYAIPAGKHWQHKKAFHVSPFNPLDQHYQWQLNPLGDSAQLHIHVYRNDGDTQKEFEAGINLQRSDISNHLLLKLLIKTPLIPLKILYGIYSHAFRLWRKSAPFYDHPRDRKNEEPSC